MTTAIIYNQFNYKAVITAAIVANEVTIDAIYDLSGPIPVNEFDKVILVGLDTVRGQSDFYGFNKIQERVFISDLDYGDKKILPVEIQASAKDEATNQALIRTLKDVDPILDGYPTMIEKAARALDFSMLDYNVLNLYINRFHDKSMDVEHLAFIYDNILKAEASLKSNTRFEVTTILNSDTKRYLDSVQVAKNNFNKSYQIAEVFDNKIKRRVMITTFMGTQYHLALRLIKLVHKNFMNICLGLNGPMVYTNLPDVPKIVLKDNEIVLN